MSNSKAEKSLLPERAVVGQRIIVEGLAVSVMSGLESIIFKRGTEPGMQNEFIRGRAKDISIQIPNMPGTVEVTGRYAACSAVRPEDQLQGTIEIVEA